MNNKKINIDLIFTFIFVILYAFFKSNIIIIVYFSLITIHSFKNIMRNDYDSIVNNIILMIPLLGITSIYGTPLSNIYIALFTILHILKNKHNKIPKQTFFLFIIFAVIDSTKYFIHNDNVYSIMNYLSVPIFYLSILCAIMSYYNAKSVISIKNMSLSFVIGTFLSILYGIITRFFNGGFLFAFVNTNILTRNSGASGDPNYYGMYICISIAILLTFILRKSKVNFLSFIIIIFFAFIGLSSSSRMYVIIVSMLLIVTLIVFIKKFFSKNIFKMLIIFSVLLTILITILPYIQNNINYVINRLGDKDITNGRSSLIVNYTEYINNDIVRLLFGMGIPQYNLRCGIGHYAHNLYIEIFVTQGIIGIGLLILFLILNIKKIAYVKVSNLLPIITFFIGGLGVNFIEVESFYMLFVLLILISKAKKIGGQNEKN